MSTSSGLTLAFCIVRCDGALYGLPAASVCEVLEGETPVHVPLAPQHVLGAIVYQGDILTVSPLSSMLNLKSSADCRALVVLETLSKERFALSVESAEQVLAIPEADIELPPQNLSPRLQSLVSGICRPGGQLVILLEVSNLSPDSLLGQFAPVDA